MEQEIEKPFRVWIFNKRESSSRQCDCYYDTETEVKYDLKGASCTDLSDDDLKALRVGLRLDNDHAILVRDLRKEVDNVYENTVSGLIERGRQRLEVERQAQLREEKKRLAAQAKQKKSTIEKKRKQFEKLKLELEAS